MRLLGHLKQRAGFSEIDVDIQNEETLPHFLQTLSSIYPTLQEVVKAFLEGRRYGEYLLLINDVDANVYDKIDDIVIKNSDVITIVPVVHGGNHDSYHIYRVPR